MPLWLNFMIIFILILVNGFFAAAEMALVSINRHRMKKLADEKNKKAMRVMSLTSDSTRYLSTIQVAITFAGFLSSALAGSNLSGDVVNMFAHIGVVMHQTVAMIIVTILLSFITLVLGELVPKRIAMSHADTYAMFSSSIVKGLMIAFTPFVWLLTVTTNGFLLLFGQNLQTDEERLTEDEIKSYILRGQLQGLYRKEEKEMIENVFRFDDLKASQIMVPRTKVFAIDKHDKTLVDTFIKSTYSRVVIYDGTIDEVEGILHIKDLFYEVRQVGFDHLNIEKMLRKPTYIPENMPIKQVFTSLKKSNAQFAVLVDEYGGTVGVLTMEDVVEEIVGNLYDEHDQFDHAIKKVKEHMFLVKGDTQVQDINKIIGLNIDEHDDRFDTLNGLVIALTGHIPMVNDLVTITHQNMTIKVEKIIQHTVAYALITKHVDHDDAS